MATINSDRGVEIDATSNDYVGCIITPMTSKDGKPLVKTVHIVDAMIVGGIVFFSLLLGASIPGLIAGEAKYLGLQEITNRLVTAFLAFCLTFLAQWARYRGVQMLSVLSGQKRQNENQSGDSK